MTRIDSAATVNELVEADAQFHQHIAVGSGNPVLASLIGGLSAPTQRARVWRGLTESGAVQRTLDEHRAIIAAIAQRQPSLTHARARGARRRGGELAAPDPAGRGRSAR